MLTREEAIKTIDTVLEDASKRATKPLSPEVAATVRSAAIQAYNDSPDRFPTAGIMARYVEYRTSATRIKETQAFADPPADAKRSNKYKPRKPILEEMSPGGENALRNLEGD